MFLASDESSSKQTKPTKFCGFTKNFVKSWTRALNRTILHKSRLMSLLERHKIPLKMVDILDPVGELNIDILHKILNREYILV